MSVALGFDYGDARIGLAIGNRQTRSSRALGSIAARRGEPDWSAIEAQIRQWAPDELIVGTPLTLDGERQPVTRRARRFAHALRQRSGLPVREVDERLSSRSAEAELGAARASGQKARRNRRGDSDGLAAAILVQQWLDES